MFLFGKKNKAAQAGAAYATQDGQLLPIEEMPDPVFADKILGDGVCVLPTDGKVCSPVAGTVDNVADASHAYGIIAQDGAEIMVHIGVDTVEMKGQGFRPRVRAGQTVQAGDVLCTVDLDAVRAAGLAPHTAILLTNGDAFTITEKGAGAAKAGDTVAFRYQKREEG